jgi:isoamyl acetate esterase
MPRLIDLCRSALAATIATLFTAMPSQAATIVFVGDSITNFGSKPGGYVDLIRRRLNNIPVKSFGLSGARVPDLWVGKTKWDKSTPYDQILQLPHIDILVIYIGVNDVWHEPGTPPDEYRSGLNALINQAKAIEATVILATPAVIGEKTPGDNPKDQQLDEFSRISREVAASQAIVLCDLRQIFQEYLAAHNPQNQETKILTTDGVHMNDQGNALIAEAMIQSIGQAKSLWHQPPP